MNKKIYQKIVYVILLFIITLNTFLSTVSNAASTIIDTTKKGSLTITKYENINGDKSKNVELEGVEFTAYLILSNIENIQDAEKYIENNETITKIKKITNTNGIAKFENLELGRYYVCETQTPENVLEPIEPFLVDIPRTNETGDNWDYDVNVYPKNITVYGNIELQKLDSNLNVLDGVTFKLQKYIDNNWTDYISGNQLSTDENGKILLENLPAGKYRLLETGTIEGYILDTSNIQEFNISLDNTNIQLTVKNEKPTITKQVKLKDNTYGKHLGEYEINNVTWKVTSDVPSIINKMNTYKITENLSDGLTFIESSVKIYGINEKQTLLNSTDYNIIQNEQQIIVTFANNNLKNYEKIEMIYETEFNSNIIYGKDGNINTSVLEYTDSIDINGSEQSKYITQITEKTTAEVHVGNVLIYKTDGEKALQGAKFKIATSKENAKNGIYITDEIGEELIAESDENGYVIFKGLAYGEDNIQANEAYSEYWIVEVQAPSYIKNGETKQYRLLSSPIKVKVNSYSGEYSEDTKHVINSKDTILPFSGGPGTVLISLTGILIILIAIYIYRKIKKDKKFDEIL